jgi:hypothetical protein
MRGDFLREYYNRLAKEGFLKSLLWGLTIGFSALLASAFLFWVFAWKAVWVCAIVFVLCVAIITPIVYFTKYKPNKKFVAKRIDELGLEERMLTMAELEGNDSYIAIRQREDALNALSTINASFIRLAISVPLIIATIVTGLLGASMTTVSALSASGVLRSGSEIVNPPEEEPILSEFTVEYEIGEGEGILMELDREMQAEERKQNEEKKRQEYYANKPQIESLKEEKQVVELMQMEYKETFWDMIKNMLSRFLKKKYL